MSQYHNMRVLKTAHDVEPLSAARADLPGVVARAPRWVVDDNVLQEITDHWFTMTEDEQKYCVQSLRPLPELVIQMSRAVVLLIGTSSPDFDLVLEGRPPKSDEDTVTRVYLAGLPLTETEASIADKAETVLGWAHCIYACRMAAQDRYVLVETKNSQRSRRRHAGSPAVSVVNVRWDAPTVKYVSERAVSYEDERKARGPVCEHAVREFLRQLKSGKVVYVRPHVRGTRGVPRRTHTKLASTVGN